MLEHRQPERRLRDEHITGDAFERYACRVGNGLVVAGGNNAQPFCFERDLGRTKHVAGGMEAYLDAAKIDALAIADRLRGASEILAETQAHDVERFPGGQHGAVTGARVIGMAMGDHGLLDGTRRIDVEFAEPAVHAALGRRENVFRSHGAKIVTHDVCAQSHRLQWGA